MKLLTVIVNYRTAPHVLEGLSELVPQLASLGDAEVWIVDNKSPDDSVSVLKREIAARGYGDRVRLIESPINGGFGAGNNVAIREALRLPSPPELFYFLNPDACPDPGAVAALVDFFAREPDAAIAGTAIHDPDGTPHASAFRFPTLWSELEGSLRVGVISDLLDDHKVSMPIPETSQPVDWVSGASVAFRRSVFETVGVFDEDFFLYFEEVDLCHRAHRAGQKTWYVREASVGHIGSVVTGVAFERRVPPYWFASRAHYLEKAYGGAFLAAANVITVLGSLGSRARHLIKGEGFGGQPHFIKDFVRYSLFPKPRP
jgi:GT2 family glycosyltransferase